MLYDVDSLGLDRFARGRWVTPPAAPRTGLNDALTHLADEPAIWVRVPAVVDETGDLIARLGELTSGEAPPAWERRLWEYPSASFLATVDPGRPVASRSPRAEGPPWSIQ